MVVSVGFFRVDILCIHIVVAKVNAGTGTKQDVMVAVFTDLSTRKSIYVMTIEFLMFVIRTMPRICHLRSGTMLVCRLGTKIRDGTPFALATSSTTLGVSSIELPTSNDSRPRSPWVNAFHQLGQ